jgi:DNA-binding transcriptional LysR family regulator
MIPAAIDLDLLRGFVGACQLGSVSRAALTLGRTQSALSMQLRRLESLVGRTLLHRNGRGVQPTPEGEMFLGYALRILALGEEAHARLNSPDLDGTVRIGMPEELALSALPAALGRFRRAHPRVHCDVLVETTGLLAPRWQAGLLDILIGATAAVQGNPLATWDIGLIWVCGADYEQDARAPLDLVISPEPCVWRSRMLSALKDAGRSWRIAFTSQSIAAAQAAIENNLGVAVSAPECIRGARMRQIEIAGLPKSLVVQYGLFAGVAQPPAIAAAASALMASVRGGPTA